MKRASPIIATISLLCALNCLAPYLGLRFESTQTMFSGLETDNTAGRNNHLFLPQWPLSGLGRYFRASATFRSAPTTEKEKYLGGLLDGQRLINGMNIRAIAGSYCHESSDLTSLTLRGSDDRVISIPEPCRSEFVREYRWVPVQLFPPFYGDEMGIYQDAWRGISPRGGT